MNVIDLHSSTKVVSAIPLFKNEHTTTVAIQLLKDELLKEHITKVPALLICIIGEVIFQNEKNKDIRLLPGDYIEIEPMVKHWVKGIVLSQLLLIK
jgi:quercetin dioxygenase-like cupin family protein